jgi:hypothetical protein
LLTTLFGELVLNPYFCNRQNYTYESSFNKQHSEKEKQNGHLPCGFGQESKTCPCDLCQLHLFMLKVIKYLGDNIFYITLHIYNVKYGESKDI